jgi:DNA polymerase III gamma/tau subunit
MTTLMQSEPLHIKYRPKEFADVIGQDATVKNLEQLFVSNRVPHTFLFTGGSGCGKTTLARIIGTRLGCDLVEVDAARYSGIDQMRELLAGAQYSGLAGDGRKCIIIDEAHALSKASWQTLLLATEQPPDHLYFALCTTEAEKVPKTIRTRAHAYDLKPVKWDLLAEYLGFVADAEELNIKDPSFLDIAARHAQGSPRQALVYLSMLDGIVTKEDCLRLVEDVDAQTDGPIALARMLVSGKGCSWAAALKVLEQIADVNPETIRLTVMAYATNTIAKEAGEKNAARLLAILSAFSVPCNASERMAPIYLAVGTLLL